MPLGRPHGLRAGLAGLGHDGAGFGGIRDRVAPCGPAITGSSGQNETPLPIEDCQDAWSVFRCDIFGVNDCPLHGLGQRGKPLQYLGVCLPGHESCGRMAMVLSRPLVSTGMIQATLKVSKQGALNLVGELHLSEMTGRGRFRARGIV